MVDASEGCFSVPILKVEKEEENQSVEEPSTSFCPNCVKLKRRILELEEELSRLKGDQNHGPPTSEQGLAEHQWVTPHPDQGPIEDLQGRILEEPGLILNQGRFFVGVGTQNLLQISVFVSKDSRFCLETVVYGVTRPNRHTSVSIPPPV